MDDRQVAEPGVVWRVPSGAAEALKRWSKQIDAVTFDAALERARRAGECRQARFEACAPLRKLIERDEIALEAHRRLAVAQKEMVVSPAPRVLSGGLGPFESWSFDLKPGLHVFARPYDLDRPGPTAGSPAQASARRDTGEFSVNLAYDVDSHGFRAASASIVVVFEVSQVGTLSVRPVCEYAFGWLVAGLHLSAHTEGRLFTTAIRDDDGKVMAHRDVTLWSRTTESDVHSEESDGYAPVWDLEVNFLAEPGRKFLVSMGATVSGDQSGDQSILFFPSWSMFCGSLSGKLLWFVAELRP
jgi:hypothetical protein